MRTKVFWCKSSSEIFTATIFAFILLLAVGCKPKDLNAVPSFSHTGNINAVIEIPAGTNKKVEYNKATQTFEIDQRDGKDRIINFLPYLGNYGFIPSTYSNPKQGGDGDALDILVISESTASGSIMEVVALGMLKLIDEEELDYKIIAIPANKLEQTITASSFVEFQKKYPQIISMIENWFLSYDVDPARVEGWGDEKEAQAEIRKWAK